MMIRENTYRFKIAGTFWRFILDSVRADAIVMPWRTCYIREEWSKDDDLRRHECVHMDQIDRDGPIKFSIQYLWWLWRDGYWNNFYEVEARQKSGEVDVEYPIGAGDHFVCHCGGIWSNDHEWPAHKESPRAQHKTEVKKA